MRQMVLGVRPMRQDLAEWLDKLAAWIEANPPPRRDAR
jgi:hypothetical protein